MKIRPLPEIDLARIAPLPKDEKRRALDQMRLGHPPYSYSPVRATISDVLNVQSDLIGPMPRAPWEKIQATIRKRSDSDAEERANLRVAEGLFDFVSEKAIIGRRHDIFPLQLGIGTKVVFWQPVILTVGERAIIPFLDPRRAKRLTAQGRRFVFSMMHERIRAADPDFADVALAIVQFALSEKGPRVPVVSLDQGVELFTFDELDHMVSETYEMWREVCEERAADARRRGAGGGGLFS
ncbi:type VI toxin-antitoxin system SocB family DNA replication inhibitor toxin [Bradyrhizobium sp. AZCC 1721]|uniref:type VI toxin-antitoxin system SocB family DNA replication inhibitor toxin n=1 Tax=Bradyrhizobium sp. AZCC 1721 TaxID=3117016 RepID=UPI002FEFE5E5